MAPGTITAGTDSSMCVNITIVSDAIDETTAEMFAVEFNTQDSGVTPLTGSTTVVICVLYSVVVQWQYKLGATVEPLYCGHLEKCPV